MKSLKLFFFFILATTAISCTKWLDVKPDTDKDRDELVNSVTGIQQMLFGVYTGMVDEGLYGRQLTYGFTEAAAYNYYYANATAGPFNAWAYTSTVNRPIIDNVWTKAYNTIANGNSLLKAIDDKKSLFTTQEFNVIKGETLALRAFLHFDLLRLFAPNYTVDSTIIALPYVATYESIRTPHEKSSTVMAKVLSDLNAAEALLKDVDPIFTIGLTNTASSKTDFLSNRQYRFNYWAVQALKARVYLYAGDKVNAELYATKVMEQGPFTWVNPSTLTGTNPDVVFMPELIFALNVSKLETYYQAYFAPGLNKIANEASSYAIRIFEDPNDYRFLYQMTADRYGNKTISGKYKQSISASAPIKKQTMPMLRLGEMYLIAAECANARGSKTTAITLMRELRLRRGYLSADRSIPDNITPAELQALIVKEFRKETYVEGQTFFNYKRLNQTTLPAFFSFFGEPVATNAKFILPIPEAEKEFGNIPSK